MDIQLTDIPKILSIGYAYEDKLITDFISETEKHLIKSKIDSIQTQSLFYNFVRQFEYSNSQFERWCELICKYKTATIKHTT